MKVVYNKIIPFKGFMAMTVVKWIFVREEYKHLEGSTSFNTMINHESIHEQQILDFTPNFFPKWLRYIIGSIFFYLWYVLEWIIKLIPCAIGEVNAYRNIGFEQEAYANENNFEYIKNRKRFSWFKEIVPLKKLS